MTTSSTATLTMIAAVGLSPKKPVRWTSSERGDADPASSLLLPVSVLMLTSNLVEGAWASGAFVSGVVGGIGDEALGLGALLLGSDAGADGFDMSCWASAAEAAPATRRSAQSASAKVFITRTSLGSVW